MANTLAGIDYENVAREGMSAFVDGLIPINAFTTDLSADIADQGTVVKTRIVPAAGTIGDLTDDHSGNYENAVQDQTLSAVSVTLGSEPVEAFGFTDKEYMQIASGVMSDTLVRMIQQHGYGIANKILDTLFAAVDTDFTAGVTVAATNFDGDDMGAVRKDWVGNAGTMKPMPACVLDVDYYEALANSNQIADQSASGLNVLQTGEIPVCRGFRMIEAPSLSAVAVNNTVGFACSPDAMAIAMRGVATQAEDEFKHFEVMQDDQTGVVLTYAVWFTRATRKLNHSFEAHWGLANGKTTSLRRITSA